MTVAADRFHVDLPFAFHWFGRVESRVTVGTNGVLTFGSAQLTCGASEPLPCAWDSSSGSVALNCVGEARGGSCTGNGEPVDGVIAPFWADLDTSANNDNEGIYYSIVTEHPAGVDWHHMHGMQQWQQPWNKFIVEYAVPIFGHPDEPHVHFEVVLAGDGSVLMQVRLTAAVLPPPCRRPAACHFLASHRRAHRTCSSSAPSSTWTCRRRRAAGRESRSGSRTGVGARERRSRTAWCQHLARPTGSATRATWR